MNYNWPFKGCIGFYRAPQRIFHFTVKILKKGCCSFCKIYVFKTVPYGLQHFWSLITVCVYTSPFKSNVWYTICSLYSRLGR